MGVNYKKELEAAAKNMILVHEPDTLIKMIIRMLVDKVGAEHASILLAGRQKDVYVLSMSCGTLGSRIPVGMARIDRDEPLIRFLSEKKNLAFGREAVLASRLKSLCVKSGLPEKERLLIGQVLHQMQILETCVCIPSYFQDELLGVLLLGRKKSGDFSNDEIDFLEVLATNVAMAIRNARLFSDLEEELQQKHQLFIRTTIALAAAIEAKDNYTHGHTTRVANLSLEIAKALMRRKKKQFDDKFFEDLHLGSLLHDIGKIGVPEYILNKKAQLTVGERNRIKEHPLTGVAILKPINELKDSLPGVRHHHERFDGTGYPDKLKGKEVPLLASIISVADSFDAMTTDRPYRPALKKTQAISEIRRLSGLQFDPDAAASFIDLCRRKII